MTSIFSLLKNASFCLWIMWRESFFYLFFFLFNHEYEFISDFLDHTFRKMVISLAVQSSPTLSDPMDCSTPGFPVHHQLLELAQTHVHRISDAIQLSHPLSSPSPPAFNLSQHQGLFQWVSCSHQVAKVNANSTLKIFLSLVLCCC